MKTSKDMPPRVVTQSVEDADQRAWYPLVLIFAVLVLGIFAGGTLSYRTYERRFRTGVEEGLAAIAELKVNDVALWRKERLGDANILFKNASFSGLVRRFLDRPDDAEAQAQLRAWLERYQAANQYERIFLLDAQGVERISTAGTAGPAAAVVSRRAGEILRSREVGFQDFYRNEQDQRVYLATLVPILDGPDFGQALGVLVLNNDPARHLYSVISRWPTPSRTAETLLVRRDGNDALFLNELKFQTNAALELRIPLERTNVPAVKAVLGQEGIVEGTDYRGEPVVAALRAIPDSPWSMVARMDIAEVYAPLRERLWLTVLLMGALLLGAGASVGLVWRQQHIQIYRERAAASETLRESLERFQLANRATFNAIWDWNLQTDAFWWNENFQTLFGYRAEEIEPDSQSWKKRIHPEDLDRAKTGVQAAIDSGQDHWSDQYRFRRKDGTYAEVEDRGYITRDASGHPVRMIGAVQDITERKRAEEALRESEERFRLAVVESPFPILLHAEDGAILQASNSWCEITGYTREELATIADWTERAYGERKGLVQADIDALYDLDHRKHEGDYGIRTKNGAMRTWEFSSAPLGRLPDGRRLVISMAMDVTERRAAERGVQRLNAELEQRVKDRTAQLEVANKELESFSYSVSHDLRAPLRAIDGFAGILEEDYTARLDGEGRRVVGVIRGEAKRMGQLIDNLLAFSRMSRQQVEPAQIDMTALAQAMFDEHAAQAPGRQLHFKLLPLPPALGDRAMLRQALANLVSNAIKYTRPRAVAEIEIGGRTEGGENLYYVKDNGVGFDMRYAGKLFNVFQRLHTEAEFEGTGVGLALVQRVIHRHGGRVWAEGKLNEGSTFYFTLPIRKDET